MIQSKKRTSLLLLCLFIVSSVTFGSELQLLGFSGEDEASFLPKNVRTSMINFTQIGDTKIAISYLLDDEFSKSVIWYGDLKTKESSSTTIDDVVGGLTFANSGELLFENYVGVRRTKGLFQFFYEDQSVRSILPDKKLERFHHRLSRPIFHTMDNFYLMASDAQDLFIIYKKNEDGPLESLIEMTTSETKKEISYIYSPAMNRNGDLVVKVSYGTREEYKKGGSQPHELLLFQASETFPLRFQIDPQVMKLGNSQGMNNHQEIAIIGQEHNRETHLYLLKNGVTKAMISGQNETVHEILWFTPEVNDSGHIAFLGTNTKGNRSIYVYNGNRVEPVVSVSDQVDFKSGVGTVLSVMDHYYLDGENRAYFFVTLSYEGKSYICLYKAFLSPQK